LLCSQVELQRLLALASKTRPLVLLLDSIDLLENAESSVSVIGKLFQKPQPNVLVILSATIAGPLDTGSFTHSLTVCNYKRQQILEKTKHEQFAPAKKANASE
jgi:hypothetical protein